MNIFTPNDRRRGKSGGGSLENLFFSDELQIAFFSILILTMNFLEMRGNDSESLIFFVLLSPDTNTAFFAVLWSVYYIALFFISICLHANAVHIATMPYRGKTLAKIKPL